MSASLLQIRSATIEDAVPMALLMVESVSAAFRGRVPEMCFDWITPSLSATNWRKTIKRLRDPACVWIAAMDGAVVGFAYVCPSTEQPYQSELKSIAVQVAHQRAGVGRMLVQHASRQLLAWGFDSMLVRVLGLNPNCAFYERLGARLLGEELYDWNGAIMPQLIYAWDDLRVLAK